MIGCFVNGAGELQTQMCSGRCVKVERGVGGKESERINLWTGAQVEALQMIFETKYRLLIEGVIFGTSVPLYISCTCLQINQVYHALYH